MPRERKSSDLYAGMYEKKKSVNYVDFSPRQRKRQRHWHFSPHRCRMHAKRHFRLTIDRKTFILFYFFVAMHIIIIVLRLNFNDTID